jgi:catechol 2,3-dioxygenase-like lactoylglutathione lyase family enzyme
MNVTHTDFVIVPTQDFDRAVAFYGDTLGLEKSKQWGNMPGQEFETGNLTLAIMQSDAFGIPFSNGAPIALRVDDVAAARGELEAAGITFQADTIDSGVCHMAYFADPDGNPLILHNRYAPEPT